MPSKKILSFVVSFMLLVSAVPAVGASTTSNVSTYSSGNSYALIATVQPAVKKSKNNICHGKGTRYYNQTKYFTSYSTIKACLKSGGRMPKQ